MEKIDNFLMPTVEIIRHSIRGIDESYNNFWDILAEIVQNAVDAIKKSSNRKGKIAIIIDKSRYSIQIIDNGCGIASKKVISLLKPFSTDKLDDPVTNGEKGVGLKFAYFQSNKFTLVTKAENDIACKVTIRDARNWKERHDEKSLGIEKMDITKNDIGTEILLENLDKELELFKLNFEQLKYVLRTKTAVGNTLAIWDDIVDIDVQLKVVDIDGSFKTDQVDYRYWLISDSVQKESVIALCEFEKWLNKIDRTDAEKRDKLKDKIIVEKGSFLHNGYRSMKWWACYVPNRNVWNDMSIKDKLADEELLKDNEWINAMNFVLHQPGIFTSVKGMPTGITINNPNTGYMGYWSNMFILFEDERLNFDIGRKSIHGQTANIYREYAKQIFNKFIKYVSKYTSGGIVTQTNDFDRFNYLTEVNQLINLNSNKVKFMKNPKDQEASVAAIFFECIGANLIQGITPVISGYRDRYDLCVKINNNFYLFEFKSHLKNIVRDFNDATKLFNEVDCIVCWEVTDEDIDKLHDLNISVSEFEKSEFSNVKDCIPHVTHIMTIINTSPVYIIDLKRVLDN